MQPYFMTVKRGVSALMAHQVLPPVRRKYTYAASRVVFLDHAGAANEPPARRAAQGNGSIRHPLAASCLTRHAGRRKETGRYATLCNYPATCYSGRIAPRNGRLAQLVRA